MYVDKLDGKIESCSNGFWAVGAKGKISAFVR